MFDVVGDIKNDTVIILELSCHQLEYCNYSPAIAVLLNIYEDHLEHYGSFDNYAKAKKNIYINQHSLDLLYCGDDVVLDKDEIMSRLIYVNTNVLPFESFESIGKVKLRGLHNLKNCSVVYSICKTFGILDGDFISLLQSYQPLSHRLEFIGVKDGVDYYDDSISTTVESAINAIKSIDNAETIILGGLDRGINYVPLIKFLLDSKIKNVLLMYESGKRIYELFNKEDTCSILRIVYCSDLSQAVHTALDVSAVGTACILSPASASYGDFKNFEERGKVFKSLIFNN